MRRDVLQLLLYQGFWSWFILLGMHPEGVRCNLIMSGAHPDMQIKSQAVEYKGYCPCNLAKPPNINNQLKTTTQWIKAIIHREPVKA